MGQIMTIIWREHNYGGNYDHYLDPGKANQLQILTPYQQTKPLSSLKSSFSSNLSFPTLKGQYITSSLPMK